VNAPTWPAGTAAARARGREPDGDCAEEHGGDPFEEPGGDPFEEPGGDRSGEHGGDVAAGTPSREALHAEIRERLGGRGLRYTGGRRAIVELLLTSDRPVNIGDIGLALPELPRSSAYRHLADLQAASVVRNVPASDDYARFELAEDLTDHHHHLLCTGCGRVIDVPSSTELETALGAYVARLAEKEGFTAHHHRVDVLGLCAECRSAN